MWGYMVKRNIIFLGMPGSGKGTISSLLEQKVDLVQVSTGDIFREEIKNETALGLEVKKLVESGAYVSDEITNQIVEKKINELKTKNQKFILDGFPRTVHQAEFLDRLSFGDYVVIYLMIEEVEVIQRLSQRFFCSKCKKSYNLTSFRSKNHPYCEIDQTQLIQRADDQPEAVKKRLDIYNEQTKPLIDFYEKKDKLVKITTNDHIDQIIQVILDTIM